MLKKYENPLIYLVRFYQPVILLLLAHHYCHDCELCERLCIFLGRHIRGRMSSLYQLTQSVYTPNSFYISPEFNIGLVWGRQAVLTKFCNSISMFSWSKDYRNRVFVYCTVCTKKSIHMKVKKMFYLFCFRVYFLGSKQQTA